MHTQQSMSAPAPVSMVGEGFIRLSLAIIRDRKMLLVRTPGEEMYFDPGGRPHDEDDRDGFQYSLSAKIFHDLGISLILPLRLMTSFRSTAVGKPDGTMVEIRLYMPNPGQPALIARPLAKQMRYTTSKDDVPLSHAALAVRQHLHNDGLID